MSDLVQFENTVAMHIKQNNIINEVTEIITKIPNYEKLKFDPEIVKYVVNVIENLIKKCDKKEINKLELASNILIKVWDLKEEQDLDILVKQIKFLNNNGAIQKVSKSKKYGKYIKDWLVKKLL